MRVIHISTEGAVPARPEEYHHPRGTLWAFVHGQEGRGRIQIVIPLAVRDFPPPPAAAPMPEQNYAFADERRIAAPTASAEDLVLRLGEEDGRFLVLWHLSPGYRGEAMYEVSGAANVIAEGHEAQGLAGHMGGAPCPVVLVTGPCRLRWNRSGRLYGGMPEWHAIFDGKRWLVEPASLASRAIAAAFADRD